ncbi:MAG: hypothetical protein Q4B19_06120, partial [Clostridia bacterium]|nr:hypothetical protein [Clostridia bacterium]
GDALTMAAAKMAGEDFKWQITGVHVRPSRLSDVAIIIGKAGLVKRSFFMQICQIERKSRFPIDARPPALL